MTFALRVFQEDHLRGQPFRPPPDNGPLEGPSRYPDVQARLPTAQACVTPQPRAAQLLRQGFGFCIQSSVFSEAALDADWLFGHCHDHLRIPEIRGPKSARPVRPPPPNSRRLWPASGPHHRPAQRMARIEGVTRRDSGIDTV